MKKKKNWEIFLPNTVGLENGYPPQPKFMLTGLVVELAAEAAVTEIIAAVPAVVGPNLVEVAAAEAVIVVVVVVAAAVVVVIVQSDPRNREFL
ncbi:hypothetical protein ElyMa_000687100 [Elysia marginata]|uniref:Uncharacterized protein n=1 Tax=Elysia marginata TaxID=1093978 RepID=A0AAV4GJB6_9GAST|nr:hypothetical protein ElyMa_000687100 [Elysia marginata]